MRRMMSLLAVLVLLTSMTLLVVTGAGAHPLKTPGTERSVAGDSQGHTHGLECAARVSPVLEELGLPCAADP